MVSFPFSLRAFRAIVPLCAVLLAGAAPSFAARPFPESGFDALRAVRVYYQMDTVALERTERGWVTDPARTPVDARMLEGVRALLAALHTDQRVSGRKGEPDAESFGLGVAEAWGVEMVPQRGKPVRIWVQLAPEERAVYWRRDGAREAYRVFNAPWSLDANPEAWRTRALFRGDYNALDVARITVRWRDSTGAAHGYVLRKLARDSAQIVEPDTLQITLRKAAEVFALTDQFAVMRHLPAGAVIPADAPERVRVRIELDDGTVHEAIAHDGGEPFAYHVLHPDTRHPVLVERWRFDKFARSLDDLTARPEYGPDFLEWAVDPDFPGVGVWAPHHEDEHAEEEYDVDLYEPALRHGVPHPGH